MPVPAVERRKGPRGKPEDRGKAAPKKVLVIDDSEHERKIIAGAIEAVLGYQSFQASSGTEGITKANEIHPDAVIMDLAMPQMNGLEASMVLSKEKPQTPIIALSFYADQLKGPKSKSFGILTLLSKVDGLGPLLKSLQDLFNSSTSTDRTAI